jgi:hypothetical protein
VEPFDFSDFEAVDIEALEGYLLDRREMPMFQLPDGLSLKSAEKYQPDGWEGERGVSATVLWSFENPQTYDVADTWVFFYLFPTVDEAVAAWDEGKAHLPSQFASVNVSLLGGDEEFWEYPSRLVTGTVVSDSEPCGFSDAVAVKNNVIVRVRTISCSTHYGADAVAAAEILRDVEGDIDKFQGGW